MHMHTLHYHGQHPTHIPRWQSSKIHQSCFLHPPKCSPATHDDKRRDLKQFYAPREQQDASIHPLFFLYRWEPQVATRSVSLRTYGCVYVYVWVCVCVCVCVFPFHIHSIKLQFWIQKEGRELQNTGIQKESSLSSLQTQTRDWVCCRFKHCYGTSFLLLLHMYVHVFWACV